jgi:DNA-binding GntR family transcriptional regulator
MEGKPVNGAPFAPLKRPPAYLQVSERIRAAILGGQIPAGELLPTETELATQFGVTRSTVREAIRLLEQGGLIGRADRKRLAVRLPSLESASRSISAAMQMRSRRASPAPPSMPPTSRCWRPT